MIQLTEERKEGENQNVINEEKNNNDLVCEINITNDSINVGK